LGRALPVRRRLCDPPFLAEGRAALGDHLGAGQGSELTPRFQDQEYGASERLVVSPGQEAQGIFEMPAGQSGNPLSPHYGDSYPAWVKGEPAPFLPGPTIDRLTLTPSPRTAGRVP